MPIVSLSRSADLQWIPYGEKSINARKPNGFRKIFCASPERYGYEVCESGNGEPALPELTLVLYVGGSVDSSNKLTTANIHFDPPPVFPMVNTAIVMQARMKIIKAWAV